MTNSVLPSESVPTIGQPRTIKFRCVSSPPPILFVPVVHNVIITATAANLIALILIWRVRCPAVDVYEEHHFSLTHTLEWHANGQSTLSGAIQLTTMYCWELEKKVPPFFRFRLWKALCSAAIHGCSYSGTALAIPRFYSGMAVSLAKHTI